MPSFNDLNGMKFGRLSVIKRVDNQGLQTVWLCECECGKESRVISQNLTSGRQISCGCYDYERKTTHGETKNGLETPEYKAWKNMKKRCYNKKDNSFPDYGGRGVKVCNHWIDSFETFLKDMGKRPSLKHSLERNDVNGDYSPENCIWATASEQIINQRVRSDNTSGQKGVSWDGKKKKWHAYISPGMKKPRINIGYFDELESAINARIQAEIKYHDRKPS